MEPTFALEELQLRLRECVLPHRNLRSCGRHRNRSPRALRNGRLQEPKPAGAMEPIVRSQTHTALRPWRVVPRAVLAPTESMA